ncbi:keratin-associated protein 9-3-like isoform X2 [Leguminivora glycinivorella]|uniref:keratin-associated protein 9-3-like isoform X2 n=1 Tax=Leguminivora glycinivorella TaxID=1035111 RepID=UPI00200E9B17|nr:keratin-associated protein 9-3-like isoform X2 [Leguminivora glycinivorella]
MRSVVIMEPRFALIFLFAVALLKYTLSVCDSRCKGEGCKAGIDDQSLCISTCAENVCVASCIAPGCVAKCSGIMCSAKCEGDGCNATCAGLKCTATCEGLKCSNTTSIWRRL